ncbi:MAG: IPT/TIG domain-containing protein, partial [Solirubrobacterales bacterium]
PVTEPACSPSPVTGSSATAVEATASGLSANTKYVYRVVATNSGGTTTGTPDQSAATLPNAPTVTNSAPGAIAQTSIVMKGTVNNNGASGGSACKIVIATEAAPGTPVTEPACSPSPVSGSSATAVEATASGLTANTKYVYRVVATNSGGTTTATPDKAVETLPNAPAVTNVAPNQGPTAGGTLVAITGTNLSGASEVKFGSTSVTCDNTEAHCKVISATEIKATSPAGSAGTVDVRAVTAGGTSALSAPADQFTYANLKQLTVTKAGSGIGTVTSSPAGINCGATCSASLGENAIVTLSGIAGFNTKAVVWTSGCESVNILNQCLVTMSGAKEVVATFDPEQQTLTVKRIGTGTGTVTSSPAGLDCRSACGPGSFNKGSSVTLAATPASGSSFAGWSGGGCSGTGSCVVAMNADTVVTAIFSADAVAPTCANTPSLCPPDSKVLVTLVTAKAKGEVVLLKVTVPRSGALTATGKGIVKTKGTATAPGTVTLRLKLTGSGRKQLQRKGKLKVNVKIVFTPTGGSPGTSTKTVTFKAKNH